jgi:integrase
MLQKSPKPYVSSNKDVALMAPGRHRVEGETGLYLLVSPDLQTRRWIFRYTSPVTRKVTETGLDMASSVSLAQAKQKALDLRRQLANGVCPIHAKREERASRVTFKEAADAWIETHKSSWRSKGMERNVNLLLRLHGKPLANKPVKEITPDMVQAALAELWAKTPLQGRRVLSAWERVLDFARARGWRQGDNPASWRGMHEYRFPRVRATERGHFHALPYIELPAFMKALRKKQARSVGAVALEWTILTACRSGETFGMQWSEIDWDKQTWTIPASRMKAGKEHVVPLSARAMELLTLQKQYSSGSYVFEGTKQTRMNDTSMRDVLSYMRVKTSVHGFRSTFRDWAGDTTHFQREHVEACLAHRVGNAVEQAYRRSDALEKRRVILDHWAAYCEGHSNGS